MAEADLGFGLFRSVEIAKKHAPKMTTYGAAIFDDVKAATAMRKDSDLGEFLFNLFDIEHATQAACRNTDLEFPAKFMRIFTTNVSMDEFLCTHQIPVLQLPALHRRMFSIEVTDKLYTPAQEHNHAHEAAVDLAADRVRMQLTVRGGGW